ncbi:hypothetical protein [Neorhodopirellula lusitana]|uniref:hypothetical protein n=1 Tax=Neorhodopirellula lusitana TaxID=445327 RepID=UPI00384EF37E
MTTIPRTLPSDTLTTKQHAFLLRFAFTIRQIKLDVTIQDMPIGTAITTHIDGEFGATIHSNLQGSGLLTDRRMQLN